jgi:hypothetical protein
MPRLASAAPSIILADIDARVLSLPQRSQALWRTLRHA